MPDGKPTKAPLIIFGCMFAMSAVTVAIVFITHSQRTEPYLDTKMRRVRRVLTPAVVPEPAAVAPTPDALRDAALEDNRSEDARQSGSVDDDGDGPGGQTTGDETTGDETSGDETSGRETPELSP